MLLLHLSLLCSMLKCLLAKLHDIGILHEIMFNIYIDNSKLLYRMAK